jgi:hypothetical protein
MPAKRARKHADALLAGTNQVTTPDEYTLRHLLSPLVT